MPTNKLNKAKRAEEFFHSAPGITIIVAIIALISGVTAAEIQAHAVVTAAKINAASKIDTPLPVITQTPTLLASLPVSPIGSECAYPPRYGFECGQSGWNKTNYYQNQAIQSVTTTKFINRNGVSSQVLALTVDFTGTIKERKDQFRESGEVQVDLNGSPPAGYETKSVNLHGVTIVAWVWASKGAGGILPTLNGIQLFVKDANSKNCYGQYNNITQDEVWFRVSWQESDPALCDAGFDSSKPKLLGVKVSLGTNSIQTYPSPLTIYVDDVDWQP